MARRKRLPKGKMQGKKLSEIQREGIIQLYAITGNKREVARQMSVSERTVHNVLNDAKTQHELAAARAQATQELAGKAHAKASMLLDSITEDDLKNERIEIKDEAGNITKILNTGPTLMQKVTAGAIMVDKTKVLSELTRELQEGQGGQDSMPLPQDVDGAIRAIAQRVKRLRILQVDFKEDNPELAEKLQQTAIKDALRDEGPGEQDADYHELDFDNPQA